MIVKPLDPSDVHLLSRALARACEVYEGHAATMRDLADAGGNPLVTPAAARALAAEFVGDAARLRDLLFGIDTSDGVALIEPTD